MKKSGLADSPFFSPSPLKTLSKKEIASLTKTAPSKRAKSQVKRPKIVVTPRHHATMTPTKPPRNHDTTTPSNHDTKPSWVETVNIEFIRKTVKEVGKEAATHRFTIAEKRAVKKIVFDYENNGLLTSENEITRIAVNFILDDHHQNGKNSLLHKVLQALNE